MTAKTAIMQHKILSNAPRLGTHQDNEATRVKKNPNEIRYNLCSKITLARGTKLIENVMSIQAKPNVIKGYLRRSLMMEKINASMTAKPTRVIGG